MLHDIHVYDFKVFQMEKCKPCLPVAPMLQLVDQYPIGFPDQHSTWKIEKII